MTTRREFCKSQLAAGLVSAIPPEWGKIFCGTEFGEGASQPVWFRGGCHSFGTGGKMSRYWLNETVSIPWELFNKQLEGCCHIPKVDFEGGRCSTKRLNPLPTEEPKSSRQAERGRKSEQYKWLWFEEASDFENTERKEN